MNKYILYNQYHTSFHILKNKKNHIYLDECRDNFKTPNDQEKWSYYNEWEQRIANNPKHLPIRHL